MSATEEIAASPGKAVAGRIGSDGHSGLPSNPAQECARAEGSSYLPVTAVMRALTVLRALNQLQQGSIADLHRITGFPKPTIVRTLETLISGGYVTRDKFSCGYRTASEVLALSCGFQGVPLIIEAGRSLAIALTEEIKWAVSIGTVVEDDVIVNFSTATISPYGYPFPTLNRPFPVTDTAIGRCFLSYCAPEKRAALIDNAIRASQRERAFVETRIEQMISEVRERGYALQDPFVSARMFDEAHQFQFIAVPVMSEGECVACLGVGFYKRAVRPEDLEGTLVEPTLAAAARIERNIELLKRNAAARQGF